jgi:hypothetical protein
MCFLVLLLYMHVRLTRKIIIAFNKILLILYVFELARVGECLEKYLKLFCSNLEFHQQVVCLNLTCS